MAFKSAKQYNEDKFGGLFRLVNDGDSAQVIFLYRSEDDVLVADTHYIKSADYNGYVHCCGKGCPACAKGIRVQTKLFVPLYNLDADEIQFWDRTMRFEPQLSQDVFSRFYNPSEIVFRITRHGAIGDVNTTYEIVAVGRNTGSDYNTILASHNAKMPDYYEHICRDVPARELHDMLNSSVNTSTSSFYNSDSLPSYQVRPRTSTTIPTSSSMLPNAEGADYSSTINDDSDSEDSEDSAQWDSETADEDVGDVQF